jgi:Holliday junction resolvase RusA-like endonuclease
MSGANEPREDRLRLVLDGVGWEAYVRNKTFRFRPKPKTWWLHPSLNTWAKMRNFQVRRLKECWRQRIGLYVLERNLGRVSGQVTVTVTYFFPDARPRDIDNYTPKFIMDALKEHLLDDDNSEVVTELRVRLCIDKARPRTEIEITVSQQALLDLIGASPDERAALRRQEQAIEAHARAEATGGQAFVKMQREETWGTRVPTFDRIEDNTPPPTPKKFSRERKRRASP